MSCWALFYTVWKVWQAKQKWFDDFYIYWMESDIHTTKSDIYGMNSDINGMNSDIYGMNFHQHTMTSDSLRVLMPNELSACSSWNKKYDVYNLTHYSRLDYIEGLFGVMSVVCLTQTCQEWHDYIQQVAYCNWATQSIASLLTAIVYTQKTTKCFNSS